MTRQAQQAIIRHAPHGCAAHIFSIQETSYDTKTTVILLPWKTALENAALTGSAEDARCWLTELGLGGSLDALPETLSGGMKRRAALARALAHPFDVLVLDEALTGLDDAAKARCLAAIDRAVGPQKTLVMACHDPAEAAALAARTVPVA